MILFISIFSLLLFIAIKVDRDLFSRDLMIILIVLFILFILSFFIVVFLGISFNFNDRPMSKEVSYSIKDFGVIETQHNGILYVYKEKIKNNEYILKVVNSHDSSIVVDDMLTNVIIYQSHPFHIGLFSIYLPHTLYVFYLKSDDKRYQNE